MESLVEKLFALFAFKDRKTMFLFLLALFLLPILVPIASEYFFSASRAERQIELVQKANAVDKAKIKDKRLSAGYEDVLNGVAKRTGGALTITPRLKATKTLKDVFSVGDLTVFISGSLLWFILGLVGLLSNHANVPEKIIVFVVMVILGLLFGWFADRIPGVDPALLKVLGIPFAEAALCSVIGTFLKGIREGN